jgi:hypothetical protein
VVIKLLIIFFGGSYCSGAMAIQLLSMSFYSYCKNHPIRTCYILDSFWFDVFGIVVGKNYNQKFYNHKAWCYLVREWTIKELCTTASVVIGTDCIGNCKCNYHAITTMTVPPCSGKNVLWNGLYLIRCLLNEFLFSLHK